jgi:hypothetical protein
MNLFHSAVNSGKHDGDTSIPSMPGIAQDLSEDEQMLLQAIVNFFTDINAPIHDVTKLLMSNFASSLKEQELDRLSMSLRNILQQIERIFEYHEHPETLNESHQLHMMLTHLKEMVKNSNLAGKLVLPL